MNSSKSDSKYNGLLIVLKHRSDISPYDFFFNYKTHPFTGLKANEGLLIHVVTGLIEGGKVTSKLTSFVSHSAQSRLFLIGGNKRTGYCRLDLLNKFRFFFLLGICSP
jgi:hypothetical protein